jgi:hypothetical protein
MIPETNLTSLPYVLFGLFIFGVFVGFMLRHSIEIKRVDMATIHDLKQSILELPDEEAFELIKNVRFLRRQIPKKTKGSTKKRSPKKLDIKSMMKEMSPEQRQKLIDELEGG